MKINIPSIYCCPKKDIAVLGCLFCFGIISSLILIANPSFFSHDELERADYVSQFGFYHYLLAHVIPSPGMEFGVPVRPISFFIQGVASLFLPSLPFMVHLIDVSMHTSVAVLLFFTIRRFNTSRQFAWITALIFIVSPLATFSTGWSAALMDRLYVLFGLVSLGAAHSYISQKRGWTSLLALFLASTLAIWSKETAFVLPVTLVIFLAFKICSLNNNRFLISFLVWSLPILLFLVYRTPALINSLNGQTATVYTISFANIAENLFVYFIYPFFPSLTEPGIWKLSSALSTWSAFVAHLCLVATLGYIFSFRIALLYLFGYFVFLAPVLLIPSKGAHYLYGSGLIVSLAISAIFTLKWQRGKKILLTVPFSLFVVSVWHAAVIQMYFYRTGFCMNTLAMTMESSYLSDGEPNVISVLIGPNAAGHVLRRFTHGKNKIGSYSPVSFKIVAWDSRTEFPAVYLFNSDCVVYKPSTSDLKVNNWGPQTAVAGTTPGLQADGSAGIWVQVSGGIRPGDAQILFSGMPALVTAVQPKLITAAVSAENFLVPGTKEISIRQISTGRVYFVGFLNVEPPN